jgi:hypothetical protein
MVIDALPPVAFSVTAQTLDGVMPPRFDHLDFLAFFAGEITMKDFR